MGKEEDKNRSLKESKWMICSIKNCRKKIIPGKEIKIGNKIYCSVCGTMIIKTSLGI
ncbi:MAG: hypothetical protein ACTSWY_05225 [Promethearchaeota archaeon]